MQLTILGCGDAFGAGGNLQTSFLVRAPAATFLIDCGVTALIGMRRLGLEPNDIDTVFVTHLHGDHFGGLAWFLIDAIYRSEEHTSELQSLRHLVCRLLLEKKKIIN